MAKEKEESRWIRGKSEEGRDKRMRIPKGETGRLVHKI